VTSGWLSVLGFIIGRMVLARSVIERAVRQQLADLDLDSGDFDVAAIVEAFEASADDEKDIQVDDGGGEGDPFAVNTRVGQVIADEWGSERLAQLRIGVHLNRTCMKSTPSVTRRQRRTASPSRRSRDC